MTQLEPNDLSRNVPSAMAPATKGRFLAALQEAWNPTPVPMPVPDEDFEHLSAVEKIAESIRYTILEIEHSVSPGGTLRAWLKVNIALAVLIGIPALLVLPVIGLVLGQFAGWSESLFFIAYYCLLALICVAIGSAVLMATHTAWKLYARVSRRR